MIAVIVFLELGSRRLLWADRTTIRTKRATLSQRGGSLLIHRGGDPRSARADAHLSRKGDAERSQTELGGFLPESSWKADTILSNPDPQIDYALREVWPEETPLHPLGTRHYWGKIQEKLVAAQLYPWTDALCRDSEAAVMDPQLFRAWRARAASEAPRPIRTWLS